MRDVRSIRGLVLVLAMLAACTTDTIFDPGRPPQDQSYSEYMQGKFDSAGHPFGARVWQAETDCNPETGESQAEGWAALPGEHESGLLCQISRVELGPGSYTLNVRLLSHEAPVPDDPPGDPETGETVENVLVLKVLNQQNKPIASRALTLDDLGQPMTYQHVWVELYQHFYLDTTARIELHWTGKHPVRVDYLELFRSQRRLVIDPPSQVLLGDLNDQTLRLELLNRPEEWDWKLELSCDDESRTARLDALLAEGQASRVDTEFRSIVTAPLAPIVEGCPWPLHLKARLSPFTSYTQSTAVSRVTLYSQPIPCDFIGGPGKTKVLLTGFESFPAQDPLPDNSSAKAVLGFSAMDMDDIAVMRVVLPVEYDSAPALVTELIQRCQPDLVIGFGETSFQVDVEQLAFNTKGATEISGGLPDNRGNIYDSTPIVEDGPASHATRLPAQRIVAALEQAGITAKSGDDISRYVCNNVFYSMMHAVEQTQITAGFIHIPSDSSYNGLEMTEKQTLIQTAIRETLNELNSH